MRSGHLSLSRAKVHIRCYFDLINLPETCTVAKSILSLCHSYRFPMLHLPMRKSLQNSHHHLILHESQQSPWEMLKSFPSHFSLNLIWAFNDLLWNAVVYIASNNKLSVKFLVGQTAILIEEMMKNIKMEKLCQTCNACFCASSNVNKPTVFVVLFSETVFQECMLGPFNFLSKIWLTTNTLVFWFLKSNLLTKLYSNIIVTGEFVLRSARRILLQV